MSLFSKLFLEVLSVVVWRADEVSYVWQPINTNGLLMENAIYHGFNFLSCSFNLICFFFYQKYPIEQGPLTHIAYFDGWVNGSLTPTHKSVACSWQLGYRTPPLNSATWNSRRSNRLCKDLPVWTILYCLVQVCHRWYCPDAYCHCCCGCWRV